VGIDLHQGWNHIGPKHNGGYPSTNWAEEQERV
jgi:hypothetical protein